jgi:nicotinic acid phosphoribosyltransferase
MAHSYIDAFPGEEEAFRAFARCHPGPVTFLVDTYDTEEGVRVAARVLTTLGLGPGCAIRLDSGDLDALSRRSRALLDAAGLTDVQIVASGGLDESGWTGSYTPEPPLMCTPWAPRWASPRTPRTSTPPTSSSSTTAVP